MGLGERQDRESPETGTEQADGRLLKEGRAVGTGKQGQRVDLSLFLYFSPQLHLRALRIPHVQHRGRSLMRPAQPRPQALGSKKDGQYPPGPRGALPWPLNPSLTAKKRQKSPRT